MGGTYRPAVLADPAELQSLGTQSLPLGDILGTDDFDRSFEMFSLYLTGEYLVEAQRRVASSLLLASSGFAVGDVRG